MELEISDCRLKDRGAKHSSLQIVDLGIADLETDITKISMCNLRSATRICNLKNHFVFTSVISNSGYWWFHCAEMLSNVRRNGFVSPGASGEALKSTVSAYGPPV